MRCNDDQYYVVKFRNNPQGTRILANELLATRLAARIGLPTAKTAVVEVGQRLIQYTEDLVIQLVRGRIPCVSGFQFGSQYPGSPAETVVFDFLPEAQLCETVNLTAFCGILAFDKWTCNTNGRQAIFFRPRDESGYQMQMIDNGFCFNAGEWNFPDAPLRGLYARHRVYDGVRGIESFEPWLTRIEKLAPSVLEEAASAIPPDWYDGDQGAVEKLMEDLFRRRTLVRDLIVSSWKSSAQPFPNWK